MAIPMPELPHQSNRLPRGRCPECGRDVALRRGGELREHTVRGRGTPMCAASGFTPAEIERRQAGDPNWLRLERRHG